MSRYTKKYNSENISIIMLDADRFPNAICRIFLYKKI